nr:MAG TPA: hypothetical protein [Inoviridae sp.]
MIVFRLLLFVDSSGMVGSIRQPEKAKPLSWIN